MNVVDEQAKKEFLYRVSRALGRTQVPQSPASDGPDVAHGPHRKRLRGLSQKERVQVFAEEAAIRDFRFYETTQENLLDTLKAIAEKTGAQRIACAADEETAKAGLTAYFEKAGYELCQWAPEASRAENIHRLAACDLGITWPFLAIADTGTVIEKSHALSGKSVSLLPQAHIAVIAASTIRGTMSDSMAELQGLYDAGDWPSSLLHVSGPSATGDIENVLVTGVHGPVAEHYVVITDA